MLKYVRGAPGGTVSSTSAANLLNSPVITRKTSFLSSSCGYSKATVIFKHVSIPLVWPSAEFFNTRREPRTFTVQLVFRTADGRELFSRPVEGVERTQIDVFFDQVFYIDNQTPDFDVEVKVLCRRTDPNADTILHTLSRSVGRSLGHSFKRYMQGQSAATLSHLDRENIANYRNPDTMVVVGSASFRLKNASLSGKTHNYTLHLHPQPYHVPQSHVLPLFGRLACQLLVQPSSLVQPLAQGTLDMFYDEGGLLLQRLFCVLQGGLLKCYNTEPNRITPSTKPDMTLPIDTNCVIEGTAFPTSLRLRLHEPNYCQLRNFILITSTRNAYLGWKNALKLQVKDTDLWDGFSCLQTNMHGATLPLLPPKSVRFGDPLHNNNNNSSPARYGFELQSTRKRPPIPFKGDGAPLLPSYQCCDPIPNEDGVRKLESAEAGRSGKRANAADRPASRARAPHAATANGYQLHPRVHDTIDERAEAAEAPRPPGQRFVLSLQIGGAEAEEPARRPQRTPTSNWTYHAGGHTMPRVRAATVDDAVTQESTRL